ncbi:Thermolysin metallopeptidase, catalytic domain [Pedobacter hartonius]|uniref:Neutral metalloproteinase n=2 Tax=Pedobacter hartonius TaxID=425514 RepID=A0A1H4G9M9_9SPHI|nr:Thermolysin metallopeptidase, catalytic domain [Pedobacter hartonius]
MENIVSPATCNLHHRHSIQCFIPPYMRLKLISSAESRPKLLKSHLGDLSLDEEIRGRRQAYAKLKPNEKNTLTTVQLKAGGVKKSVLEKISDDAAVIPKPSRLVYSAENRKALPGKLIRDESGKVSGDQDVDNVYESAGATWDFYYSLFGRNSIDNAGMKLIQTVHYLKKYDNAFWDGKQMIYGDGDGAIFASFTSDIDITGHELTHGVIQYECNLEYKDQSGALNESLADVFGIMIKQKMLNQDVRTSDWLVGEHTLVGDEYAIRSLKAPGTAYVNHPDLGTDPQPANMSGYTDDPDDNGGVHLNSGIPNHAFYLAAFDVGGFSWEKVGQVWYRAMCNKNLVSTNATFADFKQATITEATSLFGATDQVTASVRNAWNSVGV